MGCLSLALPPVVFVGDLALWYNAAVAAGIEPTAA